MWNPKVKTEVFKRGKRTFYSHSQCLPSWRLKTIHIFFIWKLLALPYDPHWSFEFYVHSLTTVFVDTRLWETKHPRKRFQNFRQSYMLSTNRIEIHQSQPASMMKRRSEDHTSGWDWWISIRSVDNTQDWGKFWKRFRGCFVFQSCVSTKTVVIHLFIFWVSILVKMASNISQRFPTVKLWRSTLPLFLQYAWVSHKCRINAEQVLDTFHGIICCHSNDTTFQEHLQLVHRIRRRSVKLAILFATNTLRYTYLNGMCAPYVIKFSNPKQKSH